jgi:hypothetical protein
VANNLFVAYDLDKPGQNYAAVEKAINSLGTAVKVQMSLYYLKTTLSAAEAEKRIWASMDSNDRLIVIAASAAYWHNALAPTNEVIDQQWNR